MIINYASKLQDVLQAIKGTWAVSEDNGWKCHELGEIKFYRKLCKAGKNVLPSTFMGNRSEIVPYLTFTKDDASGGIIGVQDQYIELESNALVVIINI